MDLSEYLYPGILYRSELTALENELRKSGIQNFDLDKLIQNIEEIQIPKEDIDHIENTKWNTDFCILEVSKCLTNVNEYYTLIRHKYNMNQNKKMSFGISQIYWRASLKLKMLQKIFTILDECDELLVCEVGRGIDLVLTSGLKEWKKIQVYDYNFRYEVIINKLCNLPFEYLTSSSAKYPFEKLEAKVLLIGNELHDWDLINEKIMETPNIKHAVINGELYK